MLQVEVDVSEVEKLIGRMLTAIDHFKRVGVGLLLSIWQTGDLHRHRPFTMRSRARGMATTVLRPHSLFEVQRSLAARRRQARLLKLLAKPRKRAYHGKLLSSQNYRTWSQRPILRAEMLTQLQKEFHDKAEQQLHW